MQSYISNVPQPKYISTLVKRDAINNDIINEIHRNFKTAVEQTKNIAQNFEGTTPEYTCNNIWHFLRTHIQYVKDPETAQLIRLPARFLNDKKGDCKSFSLFTAAILKNIYPTLPVKFRYASYTSSTIPSHVYCVMNDEQGNEIICDGVYKYSLSEKKFNNKKDYTMNVYTLSGLSNRGSIGAFSLKNAVKNIVTAVQNTASNVQAGAQNVVNVVKTGGSVKDIVKAAAAVTKTVVGAPSRAAFLGLVALNVKGLATKIYEVSLSDSTGLKNLWATKLGGDYSQLMAQVEKGRQKKQLLGIGVVAAAAAGGTAITTAEAIALAVEAATPIIVAMVQFFKSKGKSNANLNSLENGAIDTSNLTPTEVAALQASAADSAAGSESFLSKPSNLLMLAAVAAGGIYLLSKKR